MQINPTFVFDSGATQTDMNEFENAVNTVISYYDSVFTNNVTLNVVFAYGESFGSVNGSNPDNWTYNSMQPASASDFTDGRSDESLVTLGYSSVRAQLLQLAANGNALQPLAYTSLNLPSSSPFGSDSLELSTAEAKALGLNATSSGSIAEAGYDGVVGIVSNEELASINDTADWTATYPSSNSYYMIGDIEHELSEVMGRASWDGTNFGTIGGGTPDYTVMDLYRWYTSGSSPARDTTPDNGQAAYFGIDINNTVNKFFYWNNTYSTNGNSTTSAGDLGDWASSGPNGADPTDNDAYLNTVQPGIANGVSGYDLDLMNVGTFLPKPALA